MNSWIRTATPADASGIADVYLASRKLCLPFEPLTHSDCEVRQWVADEVIPSHLVFVAVEGTKIAGMMALSARQPVGWISHLYLHPDFTGRGIGARLLDHAKETLGTPIRLYTFQANTGARRFYERHGFHPIHFCDGRGNEEKCPDVLYEFRVTPCPSMAEKSLHSIQPKAEEVK